MSDSEHEHNKNLLDRFKAGDKEAANELLGKYFDRAVRAASKRISQRRLRGTASEDIAVSVFESLWKKADKQHFGEEDLTTTDEFWRLLCTMIRFKTEDHLRRENADKRGAGNVRGESIFMNAQDSSMPGLANQSDQGLTPPELAAFGDQHRKLMDMLDDESLQEVVTLRMEGNKVAEIAKHFDKSERWVKRKLALIREIWQQELDQSSA